MKELIITHTVGVRVDVLKLNVITGNIQLIRFSLAIRVRGPDTRGVVTRSIRAVVPASLRGSSHKGRDEAEEIGRPEEHDTRDQRRRV